MTPNPAINALLVTAPPTTVPPIRFTVPLLFQSATTLSVPAFVTIKDPFCTGALDNIIVPPVTVTRPPLLLTTTLAIVPKPVMTPLLVTAPPASAPPDSATVPLVLFHAEPTA